MANTDRRNIWIDVVARDRGVYRTMHYVDDNGGMRVTKQLCNWNDTEDAIIEALDAGIDVEEIADRMLGAIS